MNKSALKRQLDDQEVLEVAYSKSKRCKLEIQQKLIRNIIIPFKKLDHMIKKSLIRQPESIEKLSGKEEPKIKENTPKSNILSKMRYINKPTICMKCNRKFLAGSFTMAEGQDLYECCLQTVRSYILLQRLLRLVKNPTYD